MFIFFKATNDTKKLVPELIARTSMRVNLNRSFTGVQGAGSQNLLEHHGDAVVWNIGEIGLVDNSF